MHRDDEPNALARKSFLLTMLATVLYVGAVFAYVLR